MNWRSERDSKTRSVLTRTQIVEHAPPSSVGRLGNAHSNTLALAFDAPGMWRFRVRR
jgi:hypothetical protein